MSGVVERHAECWQGNRRPLAHILNETQTPIMAQKYSHLLVSHHHSGDCSRLLLLKNKNKSSSRDGEGAGTTLIHPLVLPFGLLTTINMIYILNHDPESTHIYRNI